MKNSVDVKQPNHLLHSIMNTDKPTCQSHHRFFWGGLKQFAAARLCNAPSPQKTGSLKWGNWSQTPTVVQPKIVWHCVNGDFDQSLGATHCSLKMAQETRLGPNNRTPVILSKQKFFEDLQMIIRHVNIEDIYKDTNCQCTTTEDMEHFLILKNFANITSDLKIFSEVTIISYTVI